MAMGQPSGGLDGDWSEMPRSPGKPVGSRAAYGFAEAVCHYYAARMGAPSVPRAHLYAPATSRVSTRAWAGVALLGFPSLQFLLLEMRERVPTIPGCHGARACPMKSTRRCLTPGARRGGSGEGERYTEVAEGHGPNGPKAPDKLAQGLENHWWRSATDASQAGGGEANLEAGSGRMCDQGTVGLEGALGVAREVPERQHANSRECKR